MPSDCRSRSPSGSAELASYGPPGTDSSAACGPLPCEMINSCTSATGASAAQKEATTARCVSTDIGTTPRPRASPPIATTILTVARPRTRSLCRGPGTRHCRASPRASRLLSCPAAGPVRGTRPRAPASGGSGRGLELPAVDDDRIDDGDVDSDDDQGPGRESRQEEQV